MRFPHKIDVHAHFIPDFYRAALLAAGHAAPLGDAEKTAIIRDNAKLFVAPS